jgi:TRAP-type mannitol/chloroaromatic compound transport system permease large subunit
MPELSAELVTIVMLGSVLALVITGFPLAYIIGFIGIVFGLFLWGEQVSSAYYLRVYRLMVNRVLLAVPLFVFMGAMLERSGIIERLYATLYLWLGGFRGGLAVVTVIVGTIMAATVGVITASVTLLTLVALPSMVKRGYSKSFAAGAVTAGGILGILIPPSVMIVVYGPWHSCRWARCSSVPSSPVSCLPPATLPISSSVPSLSLISGRLCLLKKEQFHL